MNEDKKNIDLLFEEKLKQFRESPPAYTWDRLEKDLNNKDSGSRLFYFRLAAASLLLLLAFGGGYFFATYNFKSSREVSQELSVPINKSEKIEKNGIRAEEEVKVESSASKTNINSTQRPFVKETLATSHQSVKQTEIDKPGAGSHEQSNAETLIAENKAQIIQPVGDIIENTEILEDTIEIKNTETETIAAIALENNEILEDQEAASKFEPVIIDPKAKVYGMESAIKKDVKWSVGAQVAPVLSYRDISINYANQSGNTFQDVESQLNDTEDALLSYAGGIDVNYFLSDRWSVQSGMYYSKIGQVNNDALNFRQDNDQYLLFAISTSTGSFDVSFEKIPENIKKIELHKDTLSTVDLNNVKLIQNFDLFEIPVMIKYNILSRKLGISVSGGLSPAYLISNKIVLQVEDNKYDIGSSTNLNSMIFNTSISLGINYQLSKKFSLNLEPNFKYSLSPINKGSNFDYHPYYFSWFTGLSYKF